MLKIRFRELLLTIKTCRSKAISVYAHEINKNTSTDENGKYTIHNLPSGNVKVTFVSVGFNTQNKTVNLVSGENIFDAILQENTFQMDEVIVSTAFNKLQSQNVMKVEHETVNSLRQKGATTLIEGLATIPGCSTDFYGNIYWKAGYPWTQRQPRLWYIRKV